MNTVYFAFFLQNFCSIIYTFRVFTDSDNLKGPGLGNASQPKCPLGKPNLYSTYLTSELRLWCPIHCTKGIHLRKSTENNIPTFHNICFAHASIFIPFPLLYQCLLLLLTTYPKSFVKNTTYLSWVFTQIIRGDFQWNQNKPINETALWLLFAAYQKRDF